MGSESSEGSSGGQEVLSPTEKRFDLWRRTIGLSLGPFVALLFYLLPLEGLSPQARLLSSILGLVIVFWITEPIPIPITALLGSVLCVLFGVGGAREVFSSFANPIVFLLLGSFIIAKGMEIHRLDRRLSLWVLSLPWVKSPYRILFAMGAVTAGLSMWIANTAATAMMFPIALGVLSTMRQMKQSRTKKEERRYEVAMMLMIAYSASVGGIGTLVGSPPNLIAVGIIGEQVGRRITFLEWMAFGFPLLCLMYFCLYLLLIFLHRSDITPGEEASVYFASLHREMGQWRRGEINAAVSFLCAVVLWVLPGGLVLVAGSESSLYKWYDSHIPEGVAALLAATLLFFLPTDWKRREFTLRWEQAADIDWGTILLFGGGLSLGDLMFKSGLSLVLGDRLTSLFAVHSLWGITGVAILMGIIISELTSNTASANMVVPVMIAIAKEAGVSPIPPALGACLGASYGFMLPISTPPNAIVYGSGLIPIHQMVRAGVFFDILGFLLIWAGLRLLCPLLGLA